MGKFKSPIKHHNSYFNTSKGAAKSTVEFFQHGVDIPKILILHQLRKIAPNSRSSGVGTLQYAH
jgi:hypothetical protein